MKELATGLTGSAAEHVTEKNTAAAMGSGSLPVYATPAMLALMEKAAAAAIVQCLPPGTTSVGAKAAINHIAATPTGMIVTASAKLTAVEGRKLTFEVTAFDEKKTIGTGTHERFLVKEEVFLNKAAQKKLP